MIRKKFFDMSQPVFHNCPGWPTYEMTNVRYEAVYPIDMFNAERIDMNIHTGTHLDAPFHFYPEGKTIDEMPLDLFQGEAVIVNLDGIINPKEGITDKHFEKYSALIGKDSIVALNTGWYKKRSLTSEYSHDWPYLSYEGAKWLVEKGIKGVCIDCLSIGGWYEGTGRPAHEVLLSAEVWILEEIVFPTEILEYETFYLMCFPLKLQGFSGSPTRAVGMIKYEE